MIKLLFLKYKFETLLILFLIPILFINITDSYDWEGDTALLIIQAQNILNGQPFHESLYIYNPNYPILSPSYYPVVTPLIFSSVMAFTGYDIFSLMVLYSILFGFIGLSSFYFIKNHFSSWVAFVAALLLVYNQFFIPIKSELMSDIPFALLVILVLLLINKSMENISKKNWLLAAFLTALAIQTRSLGFAIPLSVLGFVFIHWSVNGFSKVFLKNYYLPILIYFAICFLTIFSIELIFPSPSNGLSIYRNHFLLVNLQTTLQNIKLYGTVILDVFASPLNGWGILAYLVKFLALIFIVFGFVLSVRKRIFMAAVFMLIYFLVLLIYPYQSGIVRFILPIMPVLMLYFIMGFQYFLTKVKYDFVKKSIIVFFIFSQVLIAAKGNYYFLKNKPKSDLVTKSTVEAFAKVKELTLENEIIQSSFPRILALYAERKGYSTKKSAIFDDYNSDIKIFNPTYFFYSKKYSSIQDLNFIAKNNFQLLWQNSEYQLYKFENQ